MVLKAIIFDLFETLITQQEDGRNNVDFGIPECESPAIILGISEDLFEEEWVARRPERMTGPFPNYYTVIKDICTNLNLDVDDKILGSLNEKRIIS